MRAYICRLLIGVGAVLLLGTGGAAQGSLSETQTFDTEAAAVLGGWVDLNTASGGNAYGFSPTNFTAGTSPAGEAGGTIARTAPRSFYGDLTLDGVLTLEDPIAASGELTSLSKRLTTTSNLGILMPRQRRLSIQ